MKSYASLLSTLVLACALSACSSGSECDETSGKANAGNGAGLSQTRPDISPCEIGAIAGDVAANKSSDDVYLDHVKRVQAKNGADDMVTLSEEDLRVQRRELRQEQEQRHAEEREQRELDSANEYVD